MAEKKFKRFATGDTKPNSWTLLDFGKVLNTSLLLSSSKISSYMFFWLLESFHRVYCILGDVVVHIFLPQQREYYNLEEFYGNATPIELPFWFTIITIPQITELQHVHRSLWNDWNSGGSYFYVAHYRG